MWQSTELHFAADHPAGPGHFPSHPIIPGALVIDEVLAAIIGTPGDEAVILRAAKFLQPVRPGESLTLRWQSSAQGKIAFECVLAEKGLAVSGLFEIKVVAS